MHCRSLWTPPPFPTLLLSQDSFFLFFLVAGPWDLLRLCNTNPRVSSWHKGGWILVTATLLYYNSGCHEQVSACNRCCRTAWATVHWSLCIHRFKSWRPWRDMERAISLSSSDMWQQTIVEGFGGEGRGLYWDGNTAEHCKVDNTQITIP